MGPQQRPRLPNLAPRLCLQVGWGAGRLPSRGVFLLWPDPESRSPDPAGKREGGLSHSGYRVTGQGGASWFAWRGVGWLGGHGTSPLGPGAGVYSRASRRAATAPNCWTG